MQTHASIIFRSFWLDGPARLAAVYCVQIRWLKDMKTSKTTSKQKTRVGITPDMSEEHAAEMLDSLKPQPLPKPPRYTTTLTLTPQQSAILDTLVLIRQRASEAGTRPMMRAEVALICFTKGVNEEVLSLPKLPRWSEEDRQLLEKVLGRKLPEPSS
jgi:hypothetical protein